MGEIYELTRQELINLIRDYAEIWDVPPADGEIEQYVDDSIPDFNKKG